MNDQPSVLAALPGIIAIAIGCAIGIGVLWFIAPQVALVLIGGGLVGGGVLINAISHNHAHALDEARRERHGYGTRDADTARIVETVVKAMQTNGGGFLLQPPPIPYVPYEDKRVDLEESKNGHRDWREA